MGKNAVSTLQPDFTKVITCNVVPDCGDVSDVTNNNGVFGAESECDTPYPGDPTTICGSGNRLTTYYWNGVLNNWQTPANIGRYEVRSH